jgi:hypothetical protein
MTPSRRLIFWFVLAVYLGSSAAATISHAAEIDNAVGTLEHCEVIASTATDQSPCPDETDGCPYQQHALSHCTMNYAFCVPVVAVPLRPDTTPPACQYSESYRSTTGSVELHPPRA